MFSIFILFFEFIAIVLTTLGYIRNKKSQLFFSFVLVCIFSIIMAYRGTNIPDTYWYTYSFDNIDVKYDYGFSFIYNNGRFGFEYGFLWLIILFKRYISTNVHVFFWAISVFSSCSIVYGLSKLIDYIHSDTQNEYYKNIPVLCTIYFSFFGIYYCGIAVRAGIALGIILIAISKIMDRKYITFLILSIVAFSIHKLSIIGIFIFIALFFIPKIEKKLLLTFWITIGVLIVAKMSYYFFNYTSKILLFVFSKFPALDYVRFLNKAQESSEAGNAVFLDWIIGLLILITIYEIGKIYKLYNAYFCGFVIILFMANIPGFSRVSDFFIIANIPMLHEFYMHKSFSVLIRLGIIVLIVMLNTVRVLNICGWS